MIEWLLKELEKNPTGVFRKRDLFEQSKEQFEELKSLGLLIYVQPNLNCETYPCSLPCANSCPMDVVEVDNRFYAICPQDSEIDPISLNRDELDKYQFCIEKFLELVRSANKLAGSLQEIKQDYFYFGYTTYKNNRVGFVFGFTITCKSTLELTGLKHLCVDDDFLVVFSPVSMIEDISQRKELGLEKITQTSLAISLNFETYEFSVEKNISALIAQQKSESEPAEKKKKKHRPTKEKMKLRELEISKATKEYTDTYGHKPRVDEIADKTKYTVKQIRATETYAKGEIQKRKKIIKTVDTVGKSVTQSEYFSAKSELGSRTRRLSKADEALRDELIDESITDDTKDEEQHKRYLRNKKRIEREKY